MSGDEVRLTVAEAAAVTWLAAVQAVMQVNDETKQRRAEIEAETA